MEAAKGVPTGLGVGSSRSRVGGSTRGPRGGAEVVCCRSDPVPEPPVTDWGQQPHGLLLSPEVAQRGVCGQRKGEGGAPL